MSEATGGHPADGSADTTVCIPAYQAEAFIDRTLWCARNQTYRHLKILVSVDESTDGTVAICQRHAAEDGRIQVFTQGERLGWAGNVNFLLDRVETEFFFLYFHDDIIEPDYVEALRDRLIGAPEAICAYCTVVLFGLDGLDRKPRLASDFSGSAAERLMRFLAAPDRGMPLRGLTRSRLLEEGCRFSTQTKEGFDALVPYLMKVMIAGPVLGVAAPLYRHWVRRAGGLTDGWRNAPADHRLGGFRESSAEAMRIIRGALPPGDERRLVVFCLYLFVMIRVRRSERLLQVDQPIDAGSIHPAFAKLTLPPAADSIDPKLHELVEQSYAMLLLEEGRLAVAGGDAAGALPALIAATALSPDLLPAWLLLAKVLDGQGHRKARQVVGRRVRLLRRQAAAGTDGG